MARVHGLSLTLKDLDEAPTACIITAHESIIVASSGEVAEFSLGTGALLRRSLFDGSGDPSCLATFAVPRGPLADAVFVLSTDWSLVALLKDRTEAWEKRFLVGPNPKRFKEKPLSQVHAAVSPKLPLLFFSLYGHHTVRAYPLTRALPADLRDAFESEKERKSGGPAPLQLKVDHKSGIAGIACHPTTSVLFVLFQDGLVRAYDTDAARSKGSLTVLASFAWGTGQELGKKAPSVVTAVPFLPAPLAVLQLPGGPDHALLLSLGASKVAVSEISALPGRCTGQLIGTAPLPTDCRALGLHVDLSTPHAPTLLVPLRMAAEPGLTIYYAHAHTGGRADGMPLTWRIASAQGGHLERGDLATCYASGCGVLVALPMGRGPHPVFFRVFPRGSLLSGTAQKLLSPFHLPADVPNGVTRPAQGGRATVPVPSTFTWVEGGVLSSFNWPDGGKERLFQLPSADRMRVLELHHSRKQSAWLVFFEPISGGTSEGDRAWTLIHASTVGPSVGGAQFAPGSRAAAGPAPLGSIETTPWLAPGCFTGCFLGPDDGNFAILAADRLSLLVFDTTTTTSEMPPIMTVRFLSPCASVFPGPCTRGECAVWVDEDLGTVSLSQDLIAREPNLLGVAAGTPSVLAERSLQLARGETVLQVAWQAVPTARGAETSLGAILTTERVLLTGPGLEILAELRADDRLRAAGRPYASVLWLGPTLLILDAALQVAALTCDGTVTPICQLAKTPTLQRPLLAAALLDRLVTVAEIVPGAEGPCAPSQHISTRPINLVATLALGWCALSAKGILPGGPAVLKDRLRPLLAAWDVIRGAPPPVLAGCIRALAQAGLKPLAAQLCERGREALGDLANACYLTAGLWGPATRAAAEAPGRWLPLARAAAGQGEYAMAQKCYVHGGDPVEALLMAYWGGDLENIKAMGQRRHPDEEWALPGIERPRPNPALEPLLAHVAKELAAAAPTSLLSAAPTNQLEALSQMVNRGADASSSGPSPFLPSLGAAPQIIALPHGLMMFGEDGALHVPSKGPAHEATLLGLPELEGGAEDVPWTARQGGPGNLSRGSTFGSRLSGASEISSARVSRSEVGGASATGLTLSGRPAADSAPRTESESSGDDGGFVAPQTKRINIVIRPREETPSSASDPGPLAPPAPFAQQGHGGGVAAGAGGGSLRQAVAGLRIGAPNAGPGGRGFAFRTTRLDSDSSQASRSDEHSTVSAGTGTGSSGTRAAPAGLNLGGAAAAPAAVTVAPGAAAAGPALMSSAGPSGAGRAGGSGFDFF